MSIIVMIKRQCRRKHQQRHYVKGCTTIGVTLSIQLGACRMFSEQVPYMGNQLEKKAKDRKK